MSRRRPAALLAAVTAAAVLASGGVWAATRGAPPRPDTGAVAHQWTATVVRTDVAARDLEAGTIGYAGDWRLASPGSDGVLTWAPALAAVITRGRVLYEIDGHPTRLLYGDRPAWRDFTAGMSDGPDVRQLQDNLVALGVGAGLTVNDHFSAATTAAIRRWHAALGLPRTGELHVGDVQFAPGPARIAQVEVALGSRVGAGQPVLAATSTTRVVSVNLPTVMQARVNVGAEVLVTAPVGPPQPGTVTAVGRVAQVPESTGQGPPQPSTIAVTITLNNPGAVSGFDQAPVQVAITTTEHTGVLAVPVAALVATMDGGYQVVVDEAGTRRRVAVRPGIFDEVTNLVEVDATGLDAGQTIEVPEP
jgi:peptidoglycan hydrolase-like protein with peptidoglycan-binding domain